MKLITKSESCKIGCEVLRLEKLISQRRSNRRPDGKNRSEVFSWLLDTNL